MKDSKDFKAIQLNSFKDEPIVGLREKRKPKDGELLVRVERSTVNPSDLYFLKGLYGLHIPRKFPITPGFEGAGIIEDVGKDIDNTLIGKTCSIGVSVTNPDIPFHGVWAQYFYAKLSNLIIYDKKVDLDKACFAYVNPLTAYAFLDIIKKKGSKAVAQNGAFGALGKIFIKLCLANNIKLINLVRKDEQITVLKDLGAEYVLNTSKTGWEKEFSKLCTELKADLFFDCVGGKTTSLVFSLLPNNSILYHFGNLELKKLGGFDSSEFIFKNKEIKGFWLNVWMYQLTNDERKQLFSNLKKDIEGDSEVFKPLIGLETNFDDLLKNLNQYAADMSKGKVLLRPNF